MRPRAGVIAAAIAGLATGCLLGVPLGGWLERTTATAPPNPDRSDVSPPAGERATPPRTDSTEARLEAALTESWLARLQLAAKVQELREASRAELPEVLDAGISSLSDRELRSILASTVRLAPEEIADLRDLRAFSTRLAEIAMADILRPEVPNGHAGRVVFGTRPDAGGGAPGPFRPDTDRIYAVFPTEGTASDAVMVKWYRRDRPEILLFQRYAVVPGDPRGHVWLSPAEGWEPGQYKVDIYTGDETMTPVASGHYRVGD